MTKTMPKGGRKGVVRDGTEGCWPLPRHMFWFRAAGGDAGDDAGIKQSTHKFIFYPVVPSRTTTFGSVEDTHVFLPLGNNYFEHQWATCSD